MSAFKVITGTASKTVTYDPNGSFRTTYPLSLEPCDCGSVPAEAWLPSTYMCGCCGTEYPA